MIKNPMGQHKNCQHLTMWNSPSKKKSRMVTDWREIYTILTTKIWKLTIHKSILKCDLSMVVHISRCPYPESSTVCVDTNTLKLGLSRVVHSLTQTVICLRLYTVHDHLLIYLCTIPTLWFKRKKNLMIWHFFSWLIKTYIAIWNLQISLYSY